MLRPALALALITVAPLAAQSSHRPVEARITGSFRDPRLLESSGLAPSRVVPDVLWTVNDSGNDALIFATDTPGAARGSVRVSGATNIDWEAIASGPCPAGDCLYVADTGDNFEWRRTVAIYRIPEPSLGLAAPGDSARSAPAERLEVIYPDGPCDVEAAFVDRAGDLYLVSKGRSRGVRQYRVPAQAWASGSRATAELLGTLPLESDGGVEGWVTDAALSPDGLRVALLTEREIFLFARAYDGLLTAAGALRSCDISAIAAQREGIAWIDDRTFILSSESSPGTRGTIALVRCEW